MTDSDSEWAWIEESIQDGAWDIFEPGLHLEVLEDIEARGELVERDVLRAVMACAVLNQPMPEWLRRGFAVLFVRGQFGKLESWDDAFERPATEAQAVRSYRARYTAYEVLDLVREAKLNGESIDNDLFEAIGRKVGLARETAKKLYVAAKARNFG
jgi:hypothetical protein